MPAQMANRLKTKPGAISSGVPRRRGMWDDLSDEDEDVVSITMSLYMVTTKRYLNAIKILSGLFQEAATLSGALYLLGLI